MSLAAQMATDISAVFMNTDDFAVSISYVRGASTISGLTGLVSSSVFESADGMGLTRVETRDYLVEASTLAITPQRADKIIESGRTYTVTEPAGQSPFAYEDENQLILRIHTVLTRTA